MFVKNQQCHLRFSEKCFKILLYNHFWRLVATLYDMLIEFRYLIFKANQFCNVIDKPTVNPKLQMKTILR